MVLINVPSILHPNTNGGILYFTFEITYRIELECFYESIDNPQKVLSTDHECALMATSIDFNYKHSTVVLPNRNFHGQIPKGMIHNHSTHAWKSGNYTGPRTQKFVNK